MQAQAQPPLGGETQVWPSPGDTMDQDGAESFSSATSAPEVTSGGQEGLVARGEAVFLVMQRV